MSENRYGLTAEEQIRLVNGASFFGTAEIDEKDIPRLQLLDGGTGINFEQLFGDFLSSSGLEGIGGKTVVQIYVSDVESTLTKPVRELKSFRKVYLEPNEKMSVSFTLSRHAFESYDADLHRWTMEEGFYKIYAGLSSRDIQSECTVYADVESPYSYGKNTSVKVIMENKKLKNIISEFFSEMKLPFTALLTSYEYTSQDTLGKILNQVNCAEADRQTLYGRMKNVKKK